MRYLIIILLGCSLPTTMFSQAPIADEELDFVIEEFVLPGGRLGNNVQSVVQGPYGFMWFASHGGLHRFDGHNFETYGRLPSDTTGDETTLNFRWIETLMWDSDSMLWVGSWGGGLYRYNPVTGAFKHFQFAQDPNKNLNSTFVACAIEDRAGKLWFGTTNGLFQFDRKTETFTGYFNNPSDSSSLYDNQVRSLYIDRKGTLWIGMGWAWFERVTGTLGKYIPETDSFKNFNHKAVQDSSEGIFAVKGMLEDRENNFWVGTTNGLNRMNVGEGSFELMKKGTDLPYAPGMHDNPDPTVYSMLEDKSGGIWIGTIGNPAHHTHLLRYDPGTNETTELPLQGAAWDLFESSDGTIWVAGSGMSGNVYKVFPKVNSYDLFKHPVDWSELSEQAFFKLFELNGAPNVISGGKGVINATTGNYWRNIILFSDKDQALAVLVEYNLKNQSTEFHPLHALRLDKNLALANKKEGNGLLMDKDGVLWGTFTNQNVGIYRYDPGTKQTTQYLADPKDSSTLSSNNILEMIIDKKGQIWAIGSDELLNSLDPETGKCVRYKFTAAGESGRVIPRTMLEDNEGNIWVAGNLAENGFSYMAVIDPETNLERRIRLPDQGVHRTIRNLAKSPDFSYLLFSVERDGIASYDVQNDAFSFQGKKYGFPFENIADIVCDENGIWWIADADDSRFLRVESWNHQYLFAESEGPGSFRQSGYLGPDGHIYFSTSGGWFEIDPDLIDPDKMNNASSVRLVDLYTFGEKQSIGTDALIDKPIWLMDKITLPSHIETFGFSFSTFNFLHKEQKVQYRLSPYEKLWREDESSAFANYYQVPPGKYTFQIRPSNPTSDLNLPTTMLDVVVLPPWYLTWWAYGLYGFIFLSGVFAVDRIQRKRLLAKERANQKDKELAQAREIEKAYNELKATQSQLIQSEKMASLGELTAGIAHEIQNPLNFVNNFSEVNKELIEELKAERQKLKGERDESLEEEILNDLKENEEKIIHHGKRADSIVKGMLQHSRTSSDQKEPTDINALADEYLRLAYHGLRAKDKSFNADFKTDFDASIPKINVIPQDIGRVLLNLINNAFYAVAESSKLEARSNDYKPEVIVSSKKLDDKVEIRVKDNGPGIPEQVRDKIFQPFFTTKPTGSGTGLGLSLSYDIVKAHGGEIKIVSENNVGTTFTINLPTNS